ncbi:ATP-binding protein [Candidatus Margulisiibacteriota bacterium]
MKNPFVYGPVISKDYFCNRKKEIRDLLSFMKNGQNVFIYSERRLGKTSLVMNACNKLDKKEYIYCYIDLWPILSEVDLAKAFAKEISNKFTSKTRRVLEFANNFFKSLMPTLSLDDNNKPVLSFGLSNNAINKYDLVKLLNVPQELAKKYNKKIVIIFDEFQQILQCTNLSLDKIIRSVIQHHENISYVFMGSRKHLIQNMFLNKDQPLYRIGAQYPIHAISDKEWYSFLIDKFALGKIKISEEILCKLMELTHGHPFYVQYLCHTVFELCEKDTISLQLVEDALNLLLERESYAYGSLWDSLTQNQKKVIFGIALDKLTNNIFSSEVLVEIGLASQSSLQRALEILFKKDIIDKINNKYFIVDRFFSLWLKRIKE